MGGGQVGGSAVNPQTTAFNANTKPAALNSYTKPAATSYGSPNGGGVATQGGDTPEASNSNAFSSNTFGNTNQIGSTNTIGGSSAVKTGPSLQNDMMARASPEMRARIAQGYMPRPEELAAFRQN